MATPGGVSALVAAFAFGIVVNAASAALFLSIKAGNGSIFRDGQRLVLATFLLSAALWAQIGFITTAVDVDAASVCSITAIFTTVFDQLARFSIEQFLLWAINNGAPGGVGQYFQQAVLLARFAVGFVFVGFTRRQSTEVCAPISSMLPIAIIVVALDVVVLAMLTGRAYTIGVFSSAKASPDSVRRGAARGKAIVAILVGFAIWTATSVTLHLAMPTIDLILRTALPAAGITILIIIVTSSIDSFSNEPKARHSRQPESPTRRLDTRDLTTAGSEEYPPIHYEDLKRDDTNIYAQPRAMGGGMGNTTMIGIGGQPVTGALFPPMRAATEPATPGARKAGVPVKRGAFDSNGKLVISQPILEATGDQNPLNKIPTMDLEKAAEMDRERRQEALQLLQRESALIAKRPAPQPPSVSSSEDSLMRARSLKRKTNMTMSTGIVGQATMTRMEPVPMPVPMQTSATTTSAELSPGVDEIRRRSPRHNPQAESPGAVPSRTEPSPRRMSQDSEVLPSRSPSQRSRKTPSPPPARTPRDVPPKVIGAPTNQDRAKMAPNANQFQSAFYVPIRPSRQRTESEAKTDSEPPQTQLQRRPTIGLPGNPRAKAMAMAAAPNGTEEAESKQAQQQQTIMFVNNITYNDPETVQNIIDEANNNMIMDDHEIDFPLKKTNSMVHRPRPIPRKPEKDRVIFPAEPSPNQMKHKRSKSGGSLASRRSILQSAPGSPTQLPPLPPPPKSAAGLMRPHPNDTKSMTFDEKMDLFYSVDNPAPPRPAVPPVPSNFFDMSDTNTLHEDEDDRKSRATHRTTRSSFKTESVLDFSPTEPAGIRQTERSTNAISEHEDLYFISGLEETVPQNRPSVGIASKRASSPIIPPARDSAWTEASDTKAWTEAETAWGSLHSPVVAINFQKEKAKALEISRASAQEEAKDDQKLRPDAKIASELFNNRDDGRETMMFMLDPSMVQDQSRNVEEEQPREVEEQQIQESEQEQLEQEGFVEVQDDEETLPSTVFSGWHRRVGDDCPTFSERKEKMRSRMPPPIPLLLGKPSTRNPVIVKAAEPSPLESPEQALQMIQAQLRKIDQPNRDSFESQGTRNALLENLEKEMDAQQGHWEDMKHGMRDSLSTVRTSLTIDSRPQSLAKSPLLDVARASRSIPSEGRMTRRSVASVKSSRWQDRLAEAQEEYADNAPERLTTRDINFLTLSQMGSPTPPDTDDSQDQKDYKSLDAELNERFTNESVEAYTANLNQVASPKALWRPVTQQTATPSISLWAHIPARSTQVQASPIDQGSSARTAPRKDIEPLTIESRQLWQQSRNATKRSPSGLWQPPYVQRQSVVTAKTPAPSNVVKEEPRAAEKPTRPVTVRPPRRSRRITLLPDIIEDPQPLPDKRGTLGIFQFPWGEKSDTGVIQPRQTMFAIPGTMASGGPALNAALQARSMQIEETEYSSSFFDDYEDEDDGDNIDDSEEEGENSGDDFDETTLWEIASLLKTDSVLPSKNSLLPPRDGPTSSVVDDYMDEADDARESIVVGLEGILEEDEELDTQSAAVPALWTPALSVQEKRGSQHGLGVSQPDSATWKSYDNVSETIRSQPRQSEIAPIETDELWSSAGSAKKSVAVAMWSAAAVVSQVKGNHGKGLPQPDASTWAMYDAVQETARSKPRVSEEPLVIESTNLWHSAAQSVKKATAMWSAAAVVSHVKGNHGKGVSQPDDVTWSKYDFVRETSRAKPRQAEPAIIESQALWVDSPPVSPKAEVDWSQAGSGALSSPKASIVATSAVATTGVWSASTVVPQTRGDHGKGLAQPNNWELYSATTETVRTKPRQSEPAIVESSDLWSSSAQNSKPEVNWSQVGVTAQSNPKTTVGTWTAASVATTIRGEHGKGLSQPADWHLYDAVTETSRAKPRQADPAAIQSSSLWVSPPQSPQAARDWSTVGSTSTPQSPVPNVSAISSVSAVATVGVWTATTALKARGEHNKGLPQPENWPLYDATAETARAKPRKAELAAVESTSMWAEPAPAKKVTDWSKVSVFKAPKAPEIPKTRPSTPPRKVRSRANTISPAHSLLSTPMSTPRIRTDNWPLWPLWTPMPRTPIVFQNNGGLFHPRPPKPNTRTTDEEPAAIEMERYIRGPDYKELDRLESTSMWTLPVVTQGQETNWIKAASSSRMQKKVATAAQWHLELKEAEEKSYPSEWMPRFSASIDDWDAALEGAIMMSQIPDHEFPIEEAPAQKPKAPVDYSHRRVSSDDWDAALEVALMMSNLPEPTHPVAPVKTKASVDRSHRNVTAADWDAALEVAIAMSEPQQAAYAEEIPAEFGSDNDIMAQIRALEEERMFAEQQADRGSIFQGSYQQSQEQFQPLVPQVAPLHQETFVAQENNYWSPQDQQQYDSYPAQGQYADYSAQQTAYPSVFVGADGQIYHYPSQPVEEPQPQQQPQQQQQPKEEEQQAVVQPAGSRVMLRY
ncbi:hypothetical protein MGG_01299 [Pyricularia oryzae 70-15]|uniref:Uncharacterized protein n=4 Tax=Pyricularia oryzae TaxID=318829 RepID=G4MY84_PYRO7|nr:uncharacterized protein MGG_01299 [Pyricularia oryzae 70-15]EHA54415.1 hypothetical protein MGG_01299 [Pyricularia oryzae 70-15]KAI7920101.1 hypothetical protein M0657_006760 [Pyricularia oryzae]KAI7922240.1 hypothetical protein M9X92_004968 [Pyricularia oryzae]